VSFVNVVPFSRTRPNVKRLKGHVKGPKVFIQAPEKFQPFVDEFLDSLAPEDKFFEEVSKRTGYERPEELAWVALVLHCRTLKVPAQLIEPSIDKILDEAGKNLSLKGDEARPVFQEARLWFLSGTGYLRSFYAAFDWTFFWCPWRLFWRKLFMRSVAFVVNHVPGDQQDVIALVKEANAVLTDTLAKRLKDIKKSTVFLDEDIARAVDRRATEMHRQVF
jgi:hypothetical protein